MSLFIDTTVCVGCGACKAVCPTGSIRMLPGWKAAIDAGTCIYCGLCSEVCHRHAPSECVYDSGLHIQRGGSLRGNSRA